MNRSAPALCGLVSGMARDQTQSQWLPRGVVPIGACANPTSCAISDSVVLVRNPAATVASTQIAALPWDISVSASVNPVLVGPGCPQSFSKVA